MEEEENQTCKLKIEMKIYFSIVIENIYHKTHFNCHAHTQIACVEHIIISKYNSIFQLNCVTKISFC